MQIITLFRQYWKSITITVIILYLSFAPPSTFKGVPKINHLDKVVHFLMYLGLTIFLIYDFRNRKKSNAYTLPFIFLCIILPCVFGGWVEIMQGKFFSPRTAEWGDWFSDMGAVFFGWLLMHFFPKKSFID